MSRHAAPSDGDDVKQLLDALIEDLTKALAEVQRARHGWFYPWQEEA